VPANPRAWLVSAGRFKAIDAMRRRARFYAASKLWFWKATRRVDKPDPFAEVDSRYKLDPLALDSDVGFVHSPHKGTPNDERPAKMLAQSVLKALARSSRY
jgi:DNA-directed RNA polymerase specialized sigma24 family protein